MPLMPCCHFESLQGSKILQMFGSVFPDVIELNVGGTYFTTSKETLTRCSGSVLTAMFSGNIDAIPRDKEDRFFIDADGDIFKHILGYLRCNKLPPNNMAEQVYKEAIVLGIEELVAIMERMPPMLQLICREHVRSAVPGYKKFMASFIDWIADDCRVNFIGKSTFYLSLFKNDTDDDNIPNFCETFDKKHICFGSRGTMKQRISADMYFGPWDTIGSHVSESEMMDFIVSDVSEKSFQVSEYGHINGDCEYRCLVNNIWTQCTRKLFYLTVNWWPLPRCTSV